MDDATLSLKEGENHPTTGLRGRWGPFRLIEKVGQGSFGEVYRAFDTTLEREVALKLLLPHGQNTAAQTTAMLNEARALARVRHPNVVSVYGVDSHDGRVGFWSDFVRGKTLAALLAAQGPFGPAEAAHIGIDLCKAVSAVHAAGLLHRDIKTGNAMREEGGRILLMDFGLTHDLEGDQKVGGTPGYMAPELLIGEPASVSSDIYALGVLLFRLLTGKYPAEGGPRRTVLDERPDLPLGLARVVETAMDEDPKKRYASAGQMIAALSQSVPQRPKGHPVRLWLLAATAAVALAFAISPVRNLLQPSAKTVESSTAAAHADYLKARDLLEHYYKPHAIETAMQLLEKTLREDPNFAPAFADLGRANFLQFWQLRDTKYVEPIRKNCLQALALKPDLASVHVTLGMLNTETGQFDLASQELDEALRIDRSNAEAYAALSTLRKSQGRNKEVEIELQKAIDLAPLDWRWPRQLGDYYRDIGKLSEAVEQLQKATQLTPDNPRVYNNLGLVYKMQRRFPEAREALEKAIQLEPSFNRYTNLGMVLIEQGKYADSVPLFQKAIDLNPASPRPWYFLAYAYSHNGASEAKVKETYLKAIALGEELRKQRSKDAPILADLGASYAAVGMEAQAVPLLRQAAALSPDNPEMLYMTGAAYELFHHRQEALRWIEKAVAGGYSPEVIENVPELKALCADPRYLAIAKTRKVR